jgi:hypothetical protein
LVGNGINTALVRVFCNVLLVKKIEMTQKICDVPGQRGSRMEKDYTRDEILSALQNEEPSPVATAVSAAVLRYSNLFVKQLKRHKNNASPEISITLPEPENDVERIALELFARSVEESGTETRWTSDDE